MRELNEILKSGGVTLERLLREAFEAGVAAGREDIRRQLQGFFDAPSSRRGHPAIVVAPSDVRAAPGTVKPTILRHIEESSFQGITTEELIAETGFKPNSVRGTVSTLQSERAIAKVGDKWFVPTAVHVTVDEAPEPKNKGGVE